MNGPAAERNLKTGLFTKRTKVKKSKKGNQVKEEDKQIRKQEINAVFFQGPSDKFHFSFLHFTTVYTVSHSRRSQS